MARTFALTFDYLCPFARIANETVIEALRDGAEWDVEFKAFSLSQTKVHEGEPPVWERSAGADGTRGVLALQWGLVVRDRFPDRFFDWHLALYDARFDEARDIDDPAVLADVASSVGLDAAEVAAVVASGEPADALGRQHEEVVDRWAVFGVPTFIVGDEAVFVRLMDRHERAGVERVLDMLEWTHLNEFKRTRVPR
jgi:predicted DsbA family dithiol-disulfide isomerase